MCKDNCKNKPGCTAFTINYKKSRICRPTGHYQIKTKDSEGGISSLSRVTWGKTETRQKCSDICENRINPPCTAYVWHDYDPRANSGADPGTNPETRAPNWHDCVLLNTSRGIESLDGCEGETKKGELRCNAGRCSEKSSTSFSFVL